MMDFLTPSCGICGVGISNPRVHWEWHEAIDGWLLPSAEQAEKHAEARQLLRQKAKAWAEMDRRKAEREQR